jgi:deazaflavin-dependent oxidoreductase (nitroreductase family)
MTNPGAGNGLASPPPGQPGTVQRVLYPIQKGLVNPLVRWAFRVGIPDPGDALLETIGRHSRQPRVTPVCDGLEGDTFWLLSQRGHAADWVRNIEADPRVRVKVRSGLRGSWRAGTAHVLDSDDSRHRQEILRRGNVARRLCLCASGALATNLLTIRVDLDPS